MTFTLPAPPPPPPGDTVAAALAAAAAGAAPPPPPPGNGGVGEAGEVHLLEMVEQQRGQPDPPAEHQPGLPAASFDGDCVLTEVEMQALASWDQYLQSYIARARIQRQQEIDVFTQRMQALSANSVQVPGANYGERPYKGLTLLLIGDLGTWKSTWAAQWPGVFVCSNASEGGDDALDIYPKVALSLLERSRNSLDPPPVFSVRRPASREMVSADDLRQWVDAICLNHVRWGIKTVVIDSLTFFIESWIAAHLKGRTAPGSKWSRQSEATDGRMDLMTFADWGLLNNYLRGIRVDLQSQGLNVIWTVLEDRKFKTSKADMSQRVHTETVPFMQGQSKVTLPGAVKLHIYAEKRFEPHPTVHGKQVAIPVYWTAPDVKIKMLRHKYGGAFPEGCLKDPIFGTQPTFRAVWLELGRYINL